jgi:acyl-coenzyme A thioesterase 13
MVADGFAPFSKPGPFVDLIGPLYERRSQDGLILGIQIVDKHCNRRGLAHAGVLTTLADLSLGYGLGHGEGKSFITLGLSVDFAASAKVADWLECYARVQKAGRSIVFANCTISRGGESIVRASGIFKLVNPQTPSRQED